ncbi:penicillin acylase family protein [Burkholderia contaminans]|nr:penicillin acylase family protein [Cupriavidus sp.]MCA7881195.1 penicillin acylase family protein [Burkholderia contaminans]
MYDSVGQTIFETWRATAINTVFADDIGDWPQRLDQGVLAQYRVSLLLRAIKGTEAGKPMQFDYFNGRPVMEVLRQSLDETIAVLDAKFQTQDMSAWKSAVVYEDFRLANSAATELGLVPNKARVTGNEWWNALMRIDSSRLPIETVIPSGGQSYFINLAGQPTAHLNDQSERHRSFDFKKVAVSRGDIQSLRHTGKTVLSYRP